ncbi:beta-lactamase-like protein [Suillus subalutaceus]|uniref:beta-lactamase-like protein n=1 Tax=Suillus subalutaceus TaxID=48586 RepID=UPI001B86DC1F|nr:beta-lactamase-like protein [Suillus subalutaceus]KAG1858402.1 beta-lactamase-like protein [Suillus subalutaceus]
MTALSIAFRTSRISSAPIRVGIRAFSSTVKASKMKVVPVLVSADNYAYLLIDEPTGKAAVVDVLDVEKVQAVADKEGVSIVAGITTHHHQDHSGGNKAYTGAQRAPLIYTIDIVKFTLIPFKVSTYPSIPVYGGFDVPAKTDLVEDGGEFTVGDNIHVRCLATPCHTKDSICFHVTDTSNKSQSGGVFTGDTLFLGGCGRFFEGTAEQMHTSLSKLATLPDNTVVYNGHEYTAGNVAFAKTIEPDNPAIGRLFKLAQENKVTTGLSTIGDEKEWNVFMRLDKDAIKRVTGAEEPGAVMNKLRELKNNFRG